MALFFLLPPALVPEIGWLTVPVAFDVCLVFVMIQTVSESLQKSFENASTETPMTAISRTIEINLRQELGETDLPDKIAPKDGVLM